MNDDGITSPATNQVPQEVSLTAAASSMINVADRINLETYQANLGRIHNVKEMVRTLEMNNESAHKNYLIDELEKRAKDGREAGNMLARLQSQSGLSETVQITNTVPSENSEIVLPTTATLVEVPESHSSSCPTSTPTTTLPPTTQQSYPATHQWRYPDPIQAYNTDNFRYYMPVQPTAAPPFQTPVNPGQMGWYSTTRNVLQSGVYNPLAHQTGFQPAQVRQSSQSWNGFPHQVVAPAPASVSGYNSSATRMRTTPARGDLSSDSSNLTRHKQTVPYMSSATSQAPVATHTLLPQYLPILTPTYQLEAPLQGTPAVSVVPPGRPPIQPHPERVAFQSPSASQTMNIHKLHQSHRAPQQSQSQQHRQQPQFERYPQLRPQSQLNSHRPRAQPQFQKLPRPPLQPEQRPQQSQVQLPSQPPPHSLPTQQIPPQSAVRTLSNGSCQPQSQPSQPINVHEQALQRSSNPPVDQVTFNKYFQGAVERGGAYLKSFWAHAKAAGIRDEWFMAAIATVPRNVWETVVGQINQVRPTPNTVPGANTPQQGSSTAVGTNVPVFPELPSNVASVSQTTPYITRETNKSSSSAEGVTSHSAARQTSGPYAAQLQYYADQATRSIFAQTAIVPTQLSTNATPTPTVLVTPQQDLSQAQAYVRTPKDANKSTLARDILRSLGKTVPSPRQEMGGELVEKANDHKGDQLPEVTSTSVASPRSSAIPPGASFNVTSSSSTPAANRTVEEEPQRVASPGEARPGLNGQTGVINGPIMIDLTSDDSDKSEDGKTQELAYSMPMQPSGGVVDAPSRPASPTNTTNHTPLLENLTLEEPPVVVVADTDNVDVRMSSPPPSLPAEGNMESELVYPPADGVVPVSPSLEPILRKASARLSDSQLPLFLPSPPVSPVHTESPETDLDIVDDEEGGPSRKRSSVDVEEITLDTGLVTPPRNRKRRKRQVYVLVPPAPFYVKRARMKRRAAVGMESDLKDGGQDGEPQYSHLEQLLIEESKSRLLERRCRWLNCDALLNCAANLLAHLKTHAQEGGPQGLLSCRWASCQRRFDNEQERDIHLEKHTIRPLPCPLAGCDKQFDKPVEVMQHEVQHQRADYRESLKLKPTCQPIVPAIPVRLGPPPHQLPSHRVIPRRVVKCQISTDRHATLGPWILWNIFSPVDLNMRKQNASMRGRSTRQAVNHAVDNLDRRDDYDFLLALSSYPAKQPPLDDLDSTVITASAARGLTLWGSEPTSSDAPPGSFAVDAAGGGATAKGEWNTSEAGCDAEVRAVEEEGSGQTKVGMGEEDDVERMLIIPG